MSDIVLVVIAYNRPSSLQRLLFFLSKANYGSDSVNLVISIDKSDAFSKVKRVADEFVWGFGKKTVRTFNERQGLRKHVLDCGDLVFDHRALVMFEDDIIPSANFYNYVKKAIDFYADDDRVAGFSLYSPAINEMVEKPFMAEPSVFDVYALQSAQSWGQCWTQRMWAQFRRWYDENSGPLDHGLDMPQKIYNWPDSSWKKYFMKYLAENDKYFIYPYFSLSTNASEVGFHNRVANSKYQVPMLWSSKNYFFGPVEKLHCYDIFYEREGLTFPDEASVRFAVCVDLYGTKKHNFSRRYILTKRKLPYKKLFSYKASFRPHEKNLIECNPGSDIFLYDVGGEHPVEVRGKMSCRNDLNYHINAHWLHALIYGFWGAFHWMKKKLVCN